jgi:hypothetical protein
VGQLHDSVLASCKQDDVRWPAISSDNDLIGLLQMVETICIQNVAGKKVYTPYHNIFTLDRCINWTRDNTISNDEFAAQLKVNYDAVIHQCGECAFGVNFLHNTLERNGTDMSTYDALSVGDADKIQYDLETDDLIMAMLILKGSNNKYALNQVEQQYALGTMNDDSYPNSVVKALNLLNSFDNFTHDNNNNNNNNGNNNNNNSNGSDAVIAAHGIVNDYCSDDGGSDDESVLSNNSIEEVKEATLLVNVEEDTQSSDHDMNADSFKATVLANAVAEYDSDIQDVEDNFIIRVDNQQDVMLPLMRMNLLH